jgi:hypothetical protein
MQLVIQQLNPLKLYGLLLGLLFSPSFLPAQVTILEQTYGSGSSFSYTGQSGTNRLLVIIITAEFNGLDDVTSVTWGDKTLTKITSVIMGTSVRNFNAAFYLKESNISSHTGDNITISTSSGGSNVRSISGQIILLSGVLQSTPVSEFTSATASSATVVSLASSISSDNKDMIIASVSTNRNNVTFTSGGTGFTELADLQFSQHCYAVSYRLAGASPTTSDPTFTSTASAARLVMVAFEVNSTYDPLPVDFLDFSIKRDANQLKAIWRVLAENQNHFYTLEVSENAQDWIWLDNISSLGETNQLREYSYVFAPNKKYHYVRLSQTDYDGTNTLLALAAIAKQVNSIPVLTDIFQTLTNCLAKDLNGKLLSACEDCIPSDFLKETYLQSPMVFLEISNEAGFLFKGIVARKDL